VPKQIVESIIAGKMLEANDMLDAKLSEIRERKLYEMKRMFQAEVFGGLSKDDIAIRKKAGYRKAADVLGDPWSERKKKIPLPDKKKEKKIAEAALDEAGLGDGARTAHDPSWTPETKSQFRDAMAKRRAARAADRAASSGYQRPGMIQRNINTLKGRQPGYVDDRSAEDKLKEKGGRLGKLARKVGDGVGKAASQLADIGSMNLN
jgi:hypothetical protein